MNMMLEIEELLRDLGREVADERGLPPGFRFHPTDEELNTFYLASKVFHGSYSLSGVPIDELDLNRCEPWELPELGKMGEREWYFFSLRDRKYPMGLRTNRATGAGYWKATGKDREVHSGATVALVGMKKTLVFYRGRAPRGEKTNWVMHENRLGGDQSGSCRRTCKEEWVICRIYDKRGENNTGVGQSHQPEASSSAAAANSIPPPATPLLLESQAPNPVQALQFQEPFTHQIHQDYDLESLLIDPLVVNAQSPQNPSFSATMVISTTTNALRNSPLTSLMPSSSKALLSHQQEDDAVFKEQAISTSPLAIPRKCKTEASFSNAYYCHNENLLFLNELDCSLLDLAAANNTYNTSHKYHMSRPSVAFNMNVTLDPSFLMKN